MIRRQRRVREVAFSFDSFLDVVTNVVGIIIRLILVVWVGARSYSTLQLASQPGVAAQLAHHDESPIHDPLEQELEKHRRELAEAQAKLLEQMRELDLGQDDQKQTEREISEVATRQKELQQKESELELTVKKEGSTTQVLVQSFDELTRRQKKLLDELKELEKLPTLKKTLHYRTPVSKPVHSEELLFECCRGRVTFVDIAAMMNEVRQQVTEKGKLLRNSWEITDVTRPAGAFRLRYTLERQRETLDAVVSMANPAAVGGFSYGLSEWIAEPVAPARGETAAAALAEGSLFRQIADSIDAKESVVTFWVYPDSFPLYRQLRDYLYEHDIIVAGRPLPDGVPITCSRRGTRSRGQ
jgi:hypothetical protein